jgi:hypothetical protein
MTKLFVGLPEPFGVWADLHSVTVGGARDALARVLSLGNELTYLTFVAALNFILNYNLPL